MEKKLISIIIPIYNAEKYLPSCIESLINQTYENIEIILVDDESKDNSRKICEEYAKKDSRVKPIFKKNSGVADTRNVGLDNAKGEYIYFIDSDDYLNYNCLDELYKYMLSTNSDVAVCSVKSVDKDFCEQLPLNENPVVEELNNIEACKRLVVSSDYGLGIVVWNKLYKKEIFDKNRFESGMIHEDDAIIYQLIYPLKKIIYVHDDLHYYRRSDNSIMRSRFSIKRFDILKAYKIRTDYLEDKNEELYNNNLMQYLHLIVYYKYLGKKVFNLEKSKLKEFNEEKKIVFSKIKNHSFQKFLIKYFEFFYVRFLYWKNDGNRRYYE